LLNFAVCPGRNKGFLRVTLRNLSADSKSPCGQLLNYVFDLIRGIAFDFLCVGSQSQLRPHILRKYHLVVNFKGTYRKRKGKDPVANEVLEPAAEIGLPFHLKNERYP